MQCELCGKECLDCRAGTIDGVKMMLCSRCMKHGVSVKNSSTRDTPSFLLTRIRKSKERDIFSEKQMDVELVSGWHDLIRAAREKKGLTREKLGFIIGERTVTIAKLEKGDIRPSDQLVAKLEKELEIKLMEKINKSTKIQPSSSIGGGFTLGDFIKTEKK